MIHPNFDERVAPARIDPEARLSFTYDTLATDIPEIRLMILQASPDESAPVECTLEIGNLDRELEFKALSYVWGDPAITEEVFVDGCASAVTPNLVSALRQIRSAFGKTVIWVDAICVNQNDVQERNAQIKLMRLIYSKAVEVIAWLGTDYEGGANALRMLGKLSAAMDQHPQNYEWLKSIPELCSDEPNMDDELDDNFTINQSWTEIEDLLCRPYWRRIWILQETVLAQTLYLMCGHQRLEFKDNLYTVFKACQHLNRQENCPEFLSPDLAFMLHTILWIDWLRIYHYRMVWRLDESSSAVYRKLYNLVSACGSLVATDPRDKIYGLLGLAETKVVPDYTKPVVEVFLDFLRELVVEENLEFLIFGGLGLDFTSHGRQVDLPSWAPDWQAHSQERRPRIPTGCYRDSNAGGFSNELAPSPRIDGKFLRLRGLVFDKILILEPSGSIEEHDLLSKRIGVSLLNNYPLGITFIQALILVTQSGIDPLNDGLPRLKTDSESFFRVAAGFLYQLMFRAGEKTLGLSTGARRYSWWEIIESTKIPLELGSGENSDDSLIDLVFRGSPHIPVTVAASEPRLVCSEEGRDAKSDIIGEILKVGRSNRQVYTAQKRTMLQGRRIFHTKEGYIGLGLPGIAEGDVVAVVQGCNVPLIFRRVSSHFVFIGWCYVPGIMDGEAFTGREEEVIDFEIH